MPLTPLLPVSEAPEAIRQRLVRPLMPRWHFRLWRLMVAVAALAVALGAYVGLTRRALSYRLEAAAHSRQIDRLVSEWWWKEQRPHPSGDVIEKKREKDRYQNLLKHHVTLKLKYEHAATRPWMPVESDPTPPAGFSE